MSANQQVAATNSNESAVTLKLKPHGYKSLCHAREQALGRNITAREWADLFGINQSNLSRIVNGPAEPGIPFVAGCINVFGPFSFDTLFEVVPDLKRRGGGAQ